VVLSFSLMHCTYLDFIHEILVIFSPSSPCKLQQFDIIVNLFVPLVAGPVRDYPWVVLCVPVPVSALKQTPPPPPYLSPLAPGLSLHRRVPGACMQSARSSQFTVQTIYVQESFGMIQEPGGPRRDCSKYTVGMQGRGTRYYY
jgi:hypothetical protein